MFSPCKGVLCMLSPRLLLGLGWLMARERVTAMWGGLRWKKTKLSWPLHGASEGKQTEGLRNTWEEPVRGSWPQGLCRSPRLLEGLAALVGEHHGKCSIAEECFIENGHPLSVPCCPCLVLVRGLSLLSPAMKAEPLLQQALASL